VRCFPLAPQDNSHKQILLTFSPKRDAPLAKRRGGYERDIFVCTRMVLGVCTPFMKWRTMLDDVAVISRHNVAAEKTRRIYWDFEHLLQLLTISGLRPLCHQLPDENDRGRDNAISQNIVVGLLQ
jgi:hypothetical protein